MMKPNDYKLMVNCVENGVYLGHNRAHKHTDTPTAEQIRNCIEDAVIDEMCEWFVFDEIKCYEA